jgi:hypothetical protein
MQSSGPARVRRSSGGFKMRLFLYAALVFAIAFPIRSDAASTVQSTVVGNSRMDVNSSNKTITLYFNGARRQTYDFVANQVYVHGANGEILASTNLRSVVLQYAGGDQVRADIIYDELLRMVVPAMGRRIQSAMLYDPYPCDLSPCQSGIGTIKSNPWYDTTWVGPNWFGGNHQNDPGEPSPLEDYDFDRWESWRDGQCAIAHSLLTTGAIVGGLAATFGSCVLAETGVGAVVCVGSGVVLMDSVGRANEADDNCHSGYPGMGNW